MMLKQTLRVLTALRKPSTSLQASLQKLYSSQHALKLQQKLITPSLNSQTTSKNFHTIIIRNQKASLINIQDESDFKERVVESGTPVLIDFHADWCGPCKLLGPRLETLVGKENTDDAQNKVILAKVDIDEMPDLAMEFGVEAIPTVMAMRNGKITDRFVGLKDDDEIKNFIDKLLVHEV